MKFLKRKFEKLAENAPETTQKVQIFQFNTEKSQYNIENFNLALSNGLSIDEFTQFTNNLKKINNYNINKIFQSPYSRLFPISLLLIIMYVVGLYYYSTDKKDQFKYVLRCLAHTGLALWFIMTLVILIIIKKTTKRKLLERHKDIVFTCDRWNEFLFTKKGLFTKPGNSGAWLELINNYYKDNFGTNKDIEDLLEGVRVKHPNLTISVKDKDGFNFTFDGKSSFRGSDFLRLGINPMDF